MRKACMALGLTLLAPAAYSAPLVDIYAGAYSWNAELSGTVSSGGDDISFDRDLDFDKTRENVLYIGLEHPIPVLPNVRLRHSEVSDSARNTLSRQITFGGETFNIADAVSSSYDLEMTDLTLYYSPLNNWVKLDLGLNVRRLEAEFNIASSTDSARESASETIPMLHLAARGNLPFSGFYAGGEVNVVSYDGSKLQDTNVYLGWTSDFLLGVQVGYNRLDLELDDVSDLDSDFSLKGPYLALTFTF